MNLTETRCPHRKLWLLKSDPFGMLGKSRGDEQVRRFAGTW